MSNLFIGELATKTDCSVPTIRYYEDIGLLPKAKRGANGHRFYSTEDISRLRFIVRCRNFGLPIEQTQQLSTMVQNDSAKCDDVLEVIEPHLCGIRKKIEELRALEETLSNYASHCSDNCNNGSSAGCDVGSIL